MAPRPIAPETWEKLPTEVQAYILVLENALRQYLDRIAQLEQKVSELEARLNRHSGNSSQPPSQDPPQVPKNRREKSGRNPGGQPGHQGNHREPVPSEKVDKIVEHRAEACPHCRSALQHTAARQVPPGERHQVWELPEIHPVITEALCRNLLKLWPALFTFALVPGADPTNNRAERALRGPVLWRKGCFGNQSDNGSRFTERILTTVASLRQQDRNIVEFVVAAIQAHRIGLPAPSLLPMDLLLVEAA